MHEVEGGNDKWLMRILRHEIGSCDRHRLRAAAAQGLAKDVRQGVAALPESSTRRGRRAAASCCISATGMRRAIRPKTSPRRSRCGCRRASRWRSQYAGLAGAAPSSSTSMPPMRDLEGTPRGAAQSRRDRAARARTAHAARALPAQARQLRGRHARSPTTGGCCASSARRARASARVPASRSCARCGRSCERLLVRRCAHAPVSRAIMCCARSIQRARSWTWCCEHASATRSAQVAGDAGADHARHAAARPGELRPMKKPLRVLVLVHETLVPPETLEGFTRAGDRRVAHGVRRDSTTLREDGPRGEGARARRQPRGAARGDHRLEARHRLQPARGVPGHRHLRPVRGRVPRADAPAVHRLQPARHDDLARQGALEADPRLSPHPDAALRACCRASAALPRAAQAASFRCS